MPRRLAVTICATESYQYAMLPQARVLHANLRDFQGEIAIVLVGGEKMKEIAKFYDQLFKGREEGQKVTTRWLGGFKETAGAENYKNAAQLLIAQMRTAASTEARAFDADLCWSLDSDVIPKTGACFKTLDWILDIPGAYYQIAISPYPSQGGGSDMLTGRGWPERPIASDFIDKERAIPEQLTTEREALNKEIAELKGQTPSPDMAARAVAMQKRIDECPPAGNVFAMSDKHGWRRRGWLSNAYPGMGRGCVVPSDWCGFGNTLMTRAALDECDFVGYEGAGTEDLYVVWNRWHQAGMRIGSALHEPSHHVNRRKDGKFYMSTVRFVTEADEFKGECVGHLRVIHRPFYTHEANEPFNPDNDGNPVAPKDRPKPAAPAPELAQAAKQPEQPVSSNPAKP